MSLLTEAFLAAGRLQEQQKYDIGMFTLDNESLISRGRNHCATQALDGGWDRLLFIDSDIVWHWPDLKKILDSKEPIVAGLCPLKTYPLQLNFHPFKDDMNKFCQFGKTVESIKQMAAHHKAVEVSVGYVGTAFMQIDVSVFKRLIDLGVPSYKYQVNGEIKDHHDFFQTGPEDGQFFSEDWGFCKLARQAGYEIKVHSGVFVSHIGHHIYQCGSMLDQALRERETIHEES